MEHSQSGIDQVVARLAAGELGDPRQNIDSCINSLRDELKTVLPEVQQYNAGSMAISLVYQYKTRLEARTDPHTFYPLNDVQRQKLSRLNCTVSVDRIEDDALYVTMSSPNGNATGRIQISDDLISHWSKMRGFIDECGPHDETYGAPQRNTIRWMDHIIKMVEVETPHQ